MISSPYGLQITENCVICKLRHSGFFCDLPKNSIEALDRIKYASAYPQGAVLFVEGQPPRGVHIICSGRVKLSTTVNMRSPRPVVSPSDTKSMAHSWFGAESSCRCT